MHRVPALPGRVWLLHRQLKGGKDVVSMAGLRFASHQRIGSSVDTQPLIDAVPTDRSRGDLGFSSGTEKKFIQTNDSHPWMSLTHSRLISSPICALTPGPEPALVEPVGQPRHRGGV
jgi:hypothetical protein